MKYFFTLLLFLLLVPDFGMAQNLVPNPSFEDTVRCPGNSGNMDDSNFWYGVNGSPDFFHPCANSWAFYMGVPFNFGGYQNPFYGNAYAGLFTYITGYPLLREYIGVQLVQPLIIGEEYFISAFVSRGDSSFNSEILDCATNNFGFRFSTNPYGPTPFIESLTTNWAHINSNDIIYDSLGWEQVSGSFIADSAYSYLFMGNFFDINNTIVNQCVGTAYYYVDNVCVSTSPTICEITTNLPSPLQPKIQLYPNPASHSISLKNSASSHSYSILTSTGYTIKTGSVTEAENAIDVSALPNGLYFLRLDVRESFKFVVQK